MSEQTRFQFSTRPKRLTVAQWVTLAGGSVAAVVTMNVIGGAWGLPIGLAVGAVVTLLVVTRYEGTALTGWVPVILGHMLRQRTWLHSLTVTTEEILPKVLGRAVTKTSLDGHSWINDGEPIGLLDLKTPSNFALADDGTQLRDVNNWSRALASMAAPGNLVKALSWIVRIGPADPTALSDWAAKNITPGANQEIATSYRDLLEEAGPTGQSYTHTLAIRLRPGKGIKQAIALAGGTGPVVASETKIMADKLGDAGLTATPLTTPVELRNQVVSHLDLLHPPQTGTPVLALGEEWDHVRLDNVYYRVMWVESWPTAPVPPDFMGPLLHDCPVPRIITLTIEPVQRDEANQKAQRASGGLEADLIAATKAGIRHSAVKAAALESTQQREVDLTHGHALLEYSGLVAVCAANLRDLEDATKRVTAAAEASSMHLRVLHGRQRSALAAVLPLARKVS